MADSADVNAASFDSTQDDVFGRIASRYDLLYRAYLTYMKLCMPVVGWVATGGDTAAYQYLLKGRCGFPGAETFANEIAAQGFVDVTFERLSLGIVAIHVARKPGKDAL